MILPGRRLFWTISSLLGDLAQLHAHENASNPLHQGSTDKTFKKCGLTGHKAVNGSRNLMLSSIISKMCVAFSELYSLSKPKISPECFPWDYVAIYVDDNFWILMTEKVLQTSPEIFGPNRLYPRTILYSLYTGPGLEKSRISSDQDRDHFRTSLQWSIYPRHQYLFNKILLTWILVLSDTHWLCIQWNAMSAI